MSSWIALRTAIHDLDLDEAAWVEALFGEGQGLLDTGLGLFAYTYRVEPGSKIRLGSVAGRQTAPDFWGALFRWGGENQSALARIYRTGASSLGDWMGSATRGGVALSQFRVGCEPYGVGDLFTIVGHDSAGFGVFLTLPLRLTRSARAPTERRAFEHLAAELAATARLREHRRRRHEARLSASEEWVAGRVLAGAADKAIAHELGVSLSTVSTFICRVRSKLGCRPGEEAILLSGRARPETLRRRLALFERLTASECDVASELLVGASYAEIAQRRSVSIRTVASQCAAIFRKCGVSGRRELASILLSQGSSGK